MGLQINIACTRSLVVLGYLIFSFSAHADESHKGFSYGPKPEWVLAPTEAQKSKTRKQPIQYLLVDRQINVLEKHHLYARDISKPLTSDGLEQVSTVSITYNTEYEKLIVHHLKVQRNGTSVSLKEKAKLRFLNQETEADSLIHTGLISATYNLPDIRVGDIIDVAYSVIGSNPVFGGKHFGSQSLNWGVSVDQLRIRLLADQNLKTKIHNAENTVSLKAHDGYVEYLYEQSNTPAIVAEKQTVDGQSSYAWLQYSSYQSWGKVKQWARDLYARVPTSNETEELSHKLLKNSRNKQDYLLKSIEFVQEDIRYLGLEFGENTHLPHSPKEVLEKRYGDCKDKSVLLARLLSHQGIRSEPALVHTRYSNGISELLPSPGAFNHVISKIVFNDKIYWVDGTRNYQGNTLSERGVNNYGVALIVDKNNDTLVNMYDTTPQQYKIKMHEHFEISNYAKPLLYTVKTTYYGNEAEYMRYKFANNSTKNISKTYLDYYLKQYKDVEQIDTVRTFDSKNNNTFTVEEHYKLKSAIEEKETTYVLSINMSAFSNYLKSPEKQKRDLPLSLYGPATIENTFSVHFPEPPNMSFSDEETRYTTEAYDYRYTDDYLDGTYTHFAVMDIKSDRVAPEALDQYISTRKKLVDEWSFTLTYDKPELYPKDRNLVKLRDRLRVLREQYRE